MAELLPKQKEAIRETTEFIYSGKPEDLWQAAIDFLPSETSESMIAHYMAVGQYINYFLGDSLEDPLEILDDETYGEFKDAVKVHASFYINLWIVLLQGIKYVKKALLDAGYPLPKGRSAILKAIYSEEIELILGFTAGSYESLPVKEIAARFRFVQKVLKGQVREVDTLKILDTWKTQDARLHRRNVFSKNPKDILKFTQICVQALRDNRKNIPDWDNFIRSLGRWYNHPSAKTLVNKGVLTFYPSRFTKLKDMGKSWTS